MPLAKRIVETVFALRDKFTGQSKKVSAAYDNISKSADNAENRVGKSSAKIERSFGGIAASAGRVLGGIGAGVGITGQFSQFVDEVDRLGKVAAQLGTSTEELSKLQFAAEQTGVSKQILENALEKLTIRIAQAADGTGEARAALAELGLEAEQLNKLTVDEQLRRIADAFLTVETQGDRGRLAVKLFEESGAELVRTLEGGSAALDQYGAELEQLGQVITTDTAEAAAELNDALNRLSITFGAITNKVAPPVINFLNDFFDQVGLGERNLENLTKELDLAELALRKLQEAGPIARFAGVGTDEDIEAMQARVNELRREIDAIQTSQQVQEEIRQKEQGDARRHNEYMAAIEKERTTIAAEENRKRTAEIRQANAELRQARQQTTEIEKEFQQLVEDTRSARDEDTDTAKSLLDLAQPIAQAQQALAAGDFDRAVERSREAGEVLRELQEEGEYADIVLTGMAQKIRDLAVEASRAEENEIEVRLNPESVEQLRAEVDRLREELSIEIPVTAVAADQNLSVESEKRGARL